MLTSSWGGSNGRFITQAPFYFAGFAIYITLALMLSRLIARMRTKTWKEARASYGPEPYRRAEQIDVPERVKAVLEGSAKHLLRDVIGLDALKAMPAAFVPRRFVKELPVTAAEVSMYVIERGLPRGFFPGKSLEIAERGDAWQVIVRGERGDIELDETHENQSRAEISALRQYWSEYQPFVVGRLE